MNLMLSRGCLFAFNMALLILQAGAQSITQPNLPEHGFSFIYGVTNVQPQGFDWSSVSSLQNVNFDFVPADITAHAEAYPNADFSQQVVVPTGGLNENFYEYNPDYFGFWGGVDGATGVQVVHPEPVEYLSYPMGVGDVHFDSLTFEFLVNGLSYTRDLQVHMEGADIGTLQLPNGLSFQNTLRVMAVTQVHDSTVISSTHLLTSGHQYWTQDMPLPVAQTYTLTQVVDGDSSVVLSGAEFVVDATANFDLPVASAFHAFPSPAKNSLTVSGSVGSWVRVLDLQGRTLQRRQLLSERELWDVSSWPAGMHVLNVEGTRNNRRVLITH